MDSKNILADLASLINKNDPILTSLGKDLHQTSDECSPKKAEGKKIVLKVQRLESARVLQQGDSSPSRLSHKNLLNEKQTNKKQSSGLKLYTKTPNNYRSRKKQPFPRELLKEECELNSHVNPKVRCKRMLNFVLVNSARKTSTGKKLKEHLSKNPYETLEQKANEKLLFEKQENLLVPASVGESVKKLKVIKTELSKGESHTKPRRMPSPRINREPEEIITKLETSDSKPKCNKGSFKTIESDNKNSRNNQLPYGKQTHDPKRTSPSPKPSNKQRNHLNYLIKRIEHEKELQEKAANQRRQRLEERIYETKKKLMRKHIENGHSSGGRDSSIES